METSQIKLYQNYSDNVVEFESLDDFNNYYKINKADIDNLSTNALNRKYKVKNHRIGRKKGQIYLFPLKENDVQTTSSNEDNLIINEKLNSLNNRLKNIEENFLEFIEAFYDFLNEQSKPKPQQQPKQQLPKQPIQQPMYSMPESRFSTFGI